MKTCIDVNFARLSSMKLEAKVSNTQSMKLLEAKFPPREQVDWTRHLSELPVERQVNVFPEFMLWLEKKVYVWSAMESKTAPTTSSMPMTKGYKPLMTMYTNDGITPSGTGVVLDVTNLVT